MKNKITLFIFGILLFVFIPVISNGDEPYKPFIQNQYPVSDFAISKAVIKHGSVSIKIVQAKRVSKKYDKPPYLCRAWFSINKPQGTTYHKYFDDIDAVAFSYGLFIPKTQPPAPYFAVVKNGDYDGRLFLIRQDGKVFDLMGGFYFITKDKRYLFSKYASDSAGLTVFDLQLGRVVFSSEDLPAYMHQWYTRNDAYFFTASEWTDNSGMPYEKEGVAYFYDFKTHEIAEKNITSPELEASKPIAYDFDPREYEDCKTTQHKSTSSSLKLEQFIQYARDLFKSTSTKPKDHIIEKTKNRHNPSQTDEWHTVKYDGLTIKFYRVISDPSDLISVIIISGKQYTMPFDIHVGDKKEDILKKLGSPTQNKGDNLEYSLPYASYSEDVTFRFSGHALKEVQWDFEID